MRKNQRRTLFAFIITNLTYALFYAWLNPTASHNLTETNVNGPNWFSYYDFVMTFLVALFFGLNTYFFIKLKKVF
jgi:hypothetical protein